MKLDKALEEKVKQRAKAILVECRPNWDWPHTLASVYWMRELIRENGADERILIPAMYFHDTGYFGVLDTTGYSYEKIKGGQAEAHDQWGKNCSQGIVGFGLYGKRNP